MTYELGFDISTSTSHLQIETLRPWESTWYGFETVDGTRYGQDSVRHETHREEDANIIRKLGNGYHTSLNWGKLQREPNGCLDTAVVDEYKEFFDDLGDTKLSLTLHHFDNPPWFQQNGGWLNNESPEIFADYAQRVGEAFGDDVEKWITINEPGVYVFHGYLAGNFPPQHTNPVKAYAALQNLAESHVEAYEALERTGKPTSISKNLVSFEGIGNAAQNIVSKPLAYTLNNIFNDHLLDKFDRTDYFGLSYYTHLPLNPKPITEADNPGELQELGIEHDDLWGVKPRNLEDFLTKIHAERDTNNKPVVMNEMGVCTDDDEYRISVLKRNFYALHRAQTKGVNIEDASVWSAFDNIELHEGKTRRFGVTDINFETGERTVKPSGEFLAELKDTKELRLNQDLKNKY